MRFWKIGRWSLALCGLLLLGMVACAPARVEVVLYYPPGSEGQKLFQKISSFEVTLKGQAVENPDGEQTQFSVDATNPTLPNVSCKKEDGNLQLEVKIVGFDDKEQVIGVGRQVVYHPCGKPRKIFLFFSPLEEFSTLAQYDPTRGGVPGKMEKVRAGHRVTYLPDGRLLISGGAVIEGAGKLIEMLNDTEIYNPETGVFEPGPRLKAARAFHTATLIGNRIIITGGLTVENEKLSSLGSIEVFEVDEKGELIKKEVSANLSEPRAFHSATVTPNEGYLYLFGGVQLDRSSPPKLNTQWELFESGGASIGKGQIKPEHQRAWHGVTSMASGHAFIAGGVTLDAQGKWKATDSALKIQFLAGDASTKVEDAEKLKEPRVAPIVIRLNDALGSRLLVSGGMVPDVDNLFKATKVYQTIEVRSSTAKIERSLTMKEPRVFHSINQLEDGRVLVFGGFTGSTMASKAEFFAPDDTGKDLKANSNDLIQRRSRFYHSATVLNNGSLLILGGVSIEAGGKYVTLYRGELFNPRPLK